MKKKSKNGLYIDLKDALKEVGNKTLVEALADGTLDAYGSKFDSFDATDNKDYLSNLTKIPNSHWLNIADSKTLKSNKIKVESWSEAGGDFFEFYNDVRIKQADLNKLIDAESSPKMKGNVKKPKQKRLHKNRKVVMDVCLSMRKTSPTTPLYAKRVWAVITSNPSSYGYDDYEDYEDCDDSGGDSKSCLVYTHKNQSKIFTYRNFENLLSKIKKELNQ